MHSAPTLPARLDWPSAVGNFLLNFGTLDYLVFVFLKDNLPPDEFAGITDLHFKDRVMRIAQHLREEGYPAHQQTAFAHLLDRLEPLRQIRNHLAHGQLYLRPDVETHEPILTVFTAKDVDTGLSPESKHLAFPELVAALANLTEVIEEFRQLAGFKTAPDPTGRPAAQ